MTQEVFSESIKGEKILLLYAKFFNYDVIVKNKLIEMGAEVDLFDARAELNVYEKALIKIYTGEFWHKLRKYHKTIQEKQKDVNYDIVFTNSYLPIETIQGYRNTFPKARFVLYLDDSVANTKGVEKTFAYYDKVMTFDKKDSEDYGIGFRPLYFEESYCQTDERQLVYDLCFVGTIHSDRLKVIEALEDYCEHMGLSFYCFSFLQSQFMYYFYWLTKREFRKKKPSYFSYKPLPSNEVASILLSSRAILDVQHPKQTGLTMRTIETLGARKKLITTNYDIVNYDLYNPNNIAVIDRKNPQISEGFLTSPFEEIDKKLLEKYSLLGWIRTLFLSE